MKFEGTPGPWRVSDDAYTFEHCASEFYHQISGGCGYLNNETKVGFSLSGIMNIHDANLISSAPDLLEALQAVVRVADRATVEFDMARVAIAKAIGKGAVNGVD